MNINDERQQYPGRQAAPPGTHGQGRPIVHPKSPGIALLLSLLIPGVGSIYSGRVASGRVAAGLGNLVVYLIGWALTPP